MPTLEALKLLHDKATRGVALSTEEQALLSSSYAQQDNEEGILLGGKPSSDVLPALRAQIAVTTSRLLTAAQHIQKLVMENESLGQEVALLKEQVTSSRTAQPA
jgi:hypothetical protein